MAEVAFSEDGKYFSAISTDGRLRIWDTETNVLKQEFTPDLHLTSPPSCLQWILVENTQSSKQGKKKRNSSISEENNQCIALGTKNGRILIYSVAQAKVECVLEDKNNEVQTNCITSLDWHQNYGLFSSNSEGCVLEWDLMNASVRYKYNVIVDSSNNKQTNDVSAIRLVPHSQKTPAKFLVTASLHIRVWRLLNGMSELVKTLGHSGAPRPVLTLAVLQHRSWLIEGSQNERLLSFWDVTITPESIPQSNGDTSSSSKKQRKKSLTDTSVTVTNPTYKFLLEDAPKMVDVDVRQVDGGVRVDVAAATRSGVVHYYGHMLNGSSTKPVKPSVTVQTATADAQPLPLQCCKFTGGLLTVGYETGPGRLAFERITPDTKSKTQVLIRGEANSKPSSKKETDVAQNDVTYVEPMGGVTRKRVAPGAKVEVPMEARLANLSVDTRSRSQSAVNQNLTKLLVQGLHSNDKRLILMVLQHEDSAVASKTVAALPADYVPQLLEQLADMATRRTSQCLAVCTWLSALLRAHSALLLASLHGDTGDRLAQLLAIFTQRRSHLCQLLNLKGRLDLTVTQRTAQDVDDTAVLEYNDDSSSDSEMEVGVYQSDAEGASEQSWDASEPASDDD